MKTRIMTISALAICLAMSWTFTASGKTTLEKIFNALRPAASAATRQSQPRRPRTRENFDSRAGHYATLNDPQDAEITYDPAREEQRLANRRSLQSFGVKRSRPSERMKRKSP